MVPIRLVAYSDYLCPWCYVAWTRLRRLESEVPGVEVEWRSYLLRPTPGRRDLEKFRAYTESWRRPGAESDAPAFQPWTGNTAPPSHSVPPQVASKAAALEGRDAFLRLHDALFRAYFTENRDITSRDELGALWQASGLPAERLADADEPALRRAVLADHAEATELGATGVPAVRVHDDDIVITGALPYETYSRWVERLRARSAAAEGVRAG